MRTACLIALFLCLGLSLMAQPDNKKEEPWSVNEGTLIGIGGYNIKDTYLSPLKYTGGGARILNERMKVVSWGDYNISRQQLINVDVASTSNPASTSNDLSGFVDYSLGYHYRFKPLPSLKILTGASVRGSLGFIYNTRNGNNPATLKADLDLNLSAMAIYQLMIKDYPLYLRYQVETPFLGALFSPHYGQSYYEIFNQGNDSGTIQFSSYHNKFAMRNYLTVDFPIGNVTMRAGYLNSLYYTDVNNIEVHIVSHSFMIGFVKEFFSLGGKNLKKKKHLFRSAYY
ncbi:DUF3316 domain-containing protein [Parabacteroides sp. Marseille-P3160]|uniref:DUF3316 domain-containing protein n=1 Tax=Parabacteroides sp. Marseille-P3160 TaxID=1917887 RepID=UPI0009BBBD79|nr:DUF3316 domain-containing protein [Parabacteroides sp. Marseille-P3160]